MSRVVASRFTFAALLLLPCSLLLLRHFGPGRGSRNADDELPIAPAVQLSRETKPTIVRPSENWMDESVPLDPLAPSALDNRLETEPPPDVPYLPPPLQATDIPPPATAANRPAPAGR